MNINYQVKDCPPALALQGKWVSCVPVLLLPLLPLQTVFLFLLLLPRQLQLDGGGGTPSAIDYRRGKGGLYGGGNAVRWDGGTTNQNFTCSLRLKVV